MEDKKLIDKLKKQAKEISDCNLAVGWDNTMKEAANRLEQLVMLQTTVKKFLEFEKENTINDEYANDGDGRFDIWQFSELSNLLEKLKEQSSLSA